LFFVVCLKNTSTGHTKFWGAHKILGGIAPDANNVILGEKKHDQICSRGSTSMKISFLV